MPIYEYRCDQCGHKFEVIQKFSDDPLEVCEQCRGHLSKLISQTSFQLKGSGWYITDYARKSGAGDSSKESKSETKPVDTPKTDISKTDSSKPDTPKADARKTDTHKTDTHKTQTSTSNSK